MMFADTGLALSLLLTGPHEAPTALWVAVYLAAALLISRGLGRSGVEGAAFGLLTLTAAADLALFLLRGERAPIAWHLPLTAGLAVLLTVLLPRWALPRPLPRGRLSRTDLLLMILLGGAFWVLRIIQVEPSTGLSSQLGWVPLYLGESFSAGLFLWPEDFRFGTGAVGGLFYSVDMVGVAALAGGLGTGQFYPPYLATSILGIGLAVLLPLSVLRGRPAAQLVYLASLAFLLVADFQVQAGIGRHWGDTVMILGGSLILTGLAVRPAGRRTILTACCAAAFLVLARHYAALFAALLMMGLAGVAWSRWGLRRALGWWPAWVAIGGLLGLLALREIYYILNPTAFYPGGRLLSMGGSGWTYHLRGALHDWGLMTDNRWTLIGPRTLWLAGLLGLLIADRGRCLGRPRRLWIMLAPIAVMLLPLSLEILTSYRTSSVTNKPYLLAALFGAFYPAFAARWLIPGRWGERLIGRGIKAAVAVLVLWGLAGPAAGFGPGRLLAWARGYYNDHVIDRGIAVALAAEGVSTARMASRPLMYFYCEPGMGLRNYIGGSLRQDLDFWNADIQDSLRASPDMAGLLARLDWPNLYLSSRLDYSVYVEGGSAIPPAEFRAFEDQPWVERVIRFKDARLIIVKRP
ncbi:conserved protein of unknown function [Magnetospirillum sp. XM-1]|uniref:hypothetical protein n=1 Tax=Magnetospirillum sp. XM-1 TaxID=1663591 RepID=UPI00073DCA15|nr:hypothetical protein [Magnetospirillum sp. XM-1]CUW38059.1 conserved protein of unknown function [Magnetospirillum sp. XM-1]